jgi:uncharacterized protein (TIGR03435 family)
MPQETTRKDRVAYAAYDAGGAVQAGIAHRGKSNNPYTLSWRRKGGLKLRQVASTGAYSQKVGSGKFIAPRMPLSSFANFLTSVVDRPVIDMVNSPSVYDFELEWTPDYEIDPNGAHRDRGILGVLEKQAGLRLEPRKSPFQILVIDHAERIPTDN